MYNIKERLTLARERILYMPETVYEFADCLAARVNDNANPKEVVAAIHSLLRDIRNHSTRRDSVLRDACNAENFPALFAEDREQPLADARFILQVIDAVMDKDFAEAVRSRCKKQLGWKPIRWVKTLDKTKMRRNYKPHIVAATEWWTTAMMLSDEADLTDETQHYYDDYPGYEDRRYIFKGFTRDDLEYFHGALASHICYDFRKNRDNDGVMTISTLHKPDDTLVIAADYPCVYEEVMKYVFPKGTTMYISADKVEVYGAYGTEYIKVWEADTAE